MATNGESVDGEGPAEGRAVLVNSPPDHDCAELLDRPAADALDLLLVTVDGDATARLGAIRDRGHPIDRVRVVSVGDTAAPGADRRFGIEDVRTAEALSELGRYARDVVVEWRGREAATVVCFDSVTALLDRVELPLTFEFLLVLVDAIRPAGATAYFLYEPAAHGEQALRTIQHVFDETIDGDGGG